METATIESTEETPIRVGTLEDLRRAGVLSVKAGRNRIAAASGCAEREGGAVEIVEPLRAADRARAAPTAARHPAADSG